MSVRRVGLLLRLARSLGLRIAREPEPDAGALVRPATAAADELGGAEIARSLDAANVVAEARVRMERDLDAERVIRPRYWAWGFVEEAARPDLKRLPRDVSFGMLQAYYYWHDHGEALRAESYLNQALAFVGGLSGLAHPTLMPEAAYHLARNKHTPQAARIQLRQSAADMSARPVVRRAEAAILLAEGSFDAAIDAAREAIILLHFSNPEVATLEREWLDEIIAEAVTRKRERLADPFTFD